MTGPDRRELGLLAAVAVWGLAAGITLATLAIREPPPGQVASGLSTIQGVDARAPLRATLCVIVAPLVAVFLARGYARRVAADGEPWALMAIGAALVSGLWLALLDPFDTITILFVPLIAAAGFALLRRLDPQFRRSDIVLVPIFLMLFAIASLWFSVGHAGLVAAAIVCAGRLLTDLGGPSPGAARHPLPAPRGEGSTPARVLEIAKRRVRARRYTLAYFLYPAFAIALFAGDLTPRVNLFEDGHSLLAASQMLHGARAYRDIVPGHGLIDEGIVGWAAMRLGANNIGDILRVRAVFAALLPAAVYFVALAASGSADVAVLAFLFAAFVTITGTPWARPVSAIEALPGFRAVPSLLALAACATSLRTRSRRWMAVAGALAVIAELTSVEFGFYALVAVLVGAWRARPRGMVPAIFGGAIIALPAALIMLFRGWLGAYLHTMLIEIPPLSAAYSVALFHFPPAYRDLSTFPEILGGLFISRIVWIVLWCVVAISTAIGLTRRAGSRRLEPILVLGVWTVVAALSFAERTNVYFLATAAVMVACVVWRTYPPLILLLILIAAPTQRLITLAQQLRHRGSVAGYVRYDALPRARGGWFEPDNARKLAAAQAFIDRALKPNETFFDFANMPILYYLFDRRCPVRQPEVPFYQSETLQREVIARLEGEIDAYNQILNSVGRRFADR